MRPAFERLRTPVAMLLLAVFLPACVGRSWQRVPAAPFLKEGQLVSHVRVVTVDSMRVELEGAVTGSDSIAGWVVAVSGSAATAPAVGAWASFHPGGIEALELWQFSGGRTLLATVIVFGAFLTFLSVGALSDLHDGG